MAALSAILLATACGGAAPAETTFSPPASSAGVLRFSAKTLDGRSFDGMSLATQRGAHSLVRSRIASTGAVLCGERALGHDHLMHGDETLVRMLAELLTDLAWFLESADDSAVHPDDAVKQLEWMSHRLRQLPSEDRLRLVALVNERAESEPEPAFREFLKTFPEAVGLFDEDG
jgi:hypothetical protein